IALESKSLDEVKLNLESAQKQRAELNSEIEKLRAEVLSLTKTKTDAKALLDLAAAAERRLNDAQNALTNADARQKELQTDADAAQARFVQVQKETDDVRQAREKLNTEGAVLRQQIQSLKDELSASQSELQARQAAVQQEEQKLTKLQTETNTVLAMA